MSRNVPITKFFISPSKYQKFNKIKPIKEISRIFLQSEIDLYQACTFYSHSGYSACLSIACAVAAGATNVKMYDGGWRQYSSVEQPPVEASAKRYIDSFTIDGMLSTFRDFAKIGNKEPLIDAMVSTQQHKLARRIQSKMDQIKEMDYQNKINKKGSDYFDDYESDDPFYSSK